MVKIKHLVVKRWKSPLQQLIKVFCREFSGVNDHPRERGSVVVLVALSLTTLLGLCAIVADVGSLYAQKVHLQNSVDAAALAGVRELPSNPGDAIVIAIDYASKNGVASQDVQVVVDPNNDSKLIVVASKKAPTHFARFWGITDEQISISASSTAMMVPPEVLFRAVPLTIQKQVFDYTKDYVLKSGGGAGTSEWYLDDSKNNAAEKSGEASGTPGWYGALELSGTGADTYETDLANGYEGTLRVGQILDVKHGNMSGPTAKGIKTRLDSDTRVPENTIDDYENNAPQIVHIPIVEIISESGNSIQQVKIVGFAAFFLKGVAGNGNNSTVTGRFLGTLTSNGQSNNFGLCTPKLVAN